MYCTNCGTKIESGVAWCDYCGQAAPEATDGDTGGATDTDQRRDRPSPQSGNDTAEAADQPASTGQESSVPEGTAGRYGSLGTLLQSVAAPVADGDFAAGARVRSFLTGSGETTQSANSGVRHVLVGTEQQSPIWTFALLGGCYAVVVLGVGSLLGGSISGRGLLTGFCFLAGVPLLWLDADGTIRAGRLPFEKPLVVVLGVYALYPIALPAYLAYRLYYTGA